MNPTANGTPPPQINMGMQIAYTRNPILGKKRSNLVLAVINAVLRARIIRGTKDEVMMASNGGLIISLSEDIGGGSGPELQVENVDNVDQTLLNLIAGTGMDIVDNGDGSVTFTSSGGGIQMLKEVSVTADYIVCHSWDGTTEGSTAINVAKKPECRTSLASEVIDGVTVTYSYTDSNLRTSNDGTNTQIEVMHRRYKAGQVMFAGGSDHTGVSVGGVPILLVDLTDRFWSRRYVQ